MIVLAPDKFKGSLSALEAIEALQRGFSRHWPEATFTRCPIADGGEGTAHLLNEALGGQWIAQTVRGPLGATVEAGYAWIEGQHLAVIEMSLASGLALVPEAARRPLEATTFGTGELIADALARGAKRIIIGLGGSATTDGGAGMAAALGWRFEDAHGQPLPPEPGYFPQLARILPPPSLPNATFIGATDVQSPLLGTRGAARLFSPQKGATPAQVETLEAALTTLQNLTNAAPFALTPGAGAAGGLGFGLLTFCGATLQPGFDLIAELIGLETAIANATLVITGEGRLDEQTLEGKGPAGVAALARKHGKPILAFGGSLSANAPLETVFDQVHPLSQTALPLAESLARAGELLEAAAARVAAAHPYPYPFRSRHSR